MKARITVDVEVHGATRALPRLVSLLEWAEDGYGVESMKITVEESL